MFKKRKKYISNDQASNFFRSAKRLFIIYMILDHKPIFPSRGSEIELEILYGERVSFEL